MAAADARSFDPSEGHRHYPKPTYALVGGPSWDDVTAMLAAARSALEPLGLSLQPAPVRAAVKPRTESRDGVDALTGLVNRAGAFTRLHEALDSDERHLAVLFCDLDGFKGVNDTMGHGAGDEVLRQVAERLSARIPAGDVIARLGGDEFLVICTGVDSQAIAERRAKNLIAAFSDDFTVEGVNVTLGISIGIALGGHGASAESLVGDSDAAMYAAKRFRAGHTIFSESLHTAARDRRLLEADLREAIREGQMYVVYQPVLDVTSGHIVGSEALLRWRHPVRGEVSPAVFVPLAEQMGLIEVIGEQVLTTALAQQRAWMGDLGEQAPRFVAVNVSAHQLARPDFAQVVEKALADAGLPATALTLEITESALIADAETTAAILVDLAEMGVTLDIDDFGTGYSSLAYLVRLPVHALKIDRSFIWGLGEDPRLNTTVAAVITLARQLRLRCIAEGVETKEQLAWLREQGCDMVQGYHVSKPIPGGDFARLISTQRRW